MKLYTLPSLSLLMVTALSSSAGQAAVELNPAPLGNQGKLIEFANFFNNNMAGKIFISSNKNRPYQDKIVDYEYDVSYFGLQLDPAGGLSFKSTYNIKRYIYSVDANGKKTGEPVIKQNTQSSQCALRQMTRTTNELVGHCQKIADNAPNSSILGYARQLRVLELNSERLVWKDNSVGYLEGFLIDKAGYSPQYEIQTLSFEVKAKDQQSRQTVMTKKVSTYNYDMERDQMGSLLTETSAESTATAL
jgi:hypothetical protein